MTRGRSLGPESRLGPLENRLGQPESRLGRPESSLGRPENRLGRDCCNDIWALAGTGGWLAGWRAPEFEESNFIRHFRALTTAGWLAA